MNHNEVVRVNTMNDDVRKEISEDIKEPVDAEMSISSQTPKKRFPEDYVDYDTEGAYKDIADMHIHIREGFKLGDGIKPEKPFKNIVFAGMGGSAIAGSLLKAFIDDSEDAESIPIECVRGYHAPKTITKDSLLIAISYSGNTEETLSTYKTALRKGCQAITLSSGGKLQELAKLNAHPHILIPHGLQPRMALGYLFFPLLKVCENCKLIGSESERVKALSESLKQMGLAQKAVDLSEKCLNKIPLVYADSTLYPVAYRWKTQMNENAKTLSYAHEFSEFNHNEILSFKNMPASVHAIFLSSDKQHRRVTKRFELSKKILQHAGVGVTEIAVKGDLLKQFFTAILLGDLTSYFLALRYECDPTPVETIERFKKDLGPFLI